MDGSLHAAETAGRYITIFQRMELTMSPGDGRVHASDGSSREDDFRIVRSFHARIAVLRSALMRRRAMLAVPLRDDVRQRSPSPLDNKARVHDRSAQVAESGRASTVHGAGRRLVKTS